MLFMRVSLVVTRALPGHAAVPRELYSMPSVTCYLGVSLARTGVHSSSFIVSMWLHSYLNLFRLDYMATEEVFCTLS